MNAKEKLFFQYTRFNSFVKRDADILSENYDLILVGFDPKQKWHLPFLLIKQLFVTPFYLINNKGALVYFGGYHSLIPCFYAKLMRKKSVIIVGGTDAVNFPEINYGNFRKKFLAWFTKKSYLLCSVICPVHKTLAYTNYSYFNNSKQGVLAFLPNVKNKLVTINNGYRPWLWPLMNLERKENSFLTVALTIKGNYYERKGIDLIIEAAKNFPEFNFTVVGADDKKVINSAPKNINWVERVPFEQLKEIYNQHQFYLQLSICEGLPNSLCEAMLCGCVPIGSSAMSIPEIIGNAGFVIEKRDKSLLFDALIKATKSDFKQLSLLSRKRIEKNYNFDERKNDILRLFF